MHAMILAGGAGERLRPYTDYAPKPLIPILGRPLLHWQIKWLKEGGIQDIILLVGYKWHIIHTYFNTGEEYGVKLTYSVEKEKLGTGGAIKQGMQYLPENEDRFLVLNGDILTYDKVDNLIAADDYFGEKVLGTIMLVQLRSPFGIINTEGYCITKFQEKPQLPYFINGGIYILHRGIKDKLPDKGNLETETFPFLAERKRLFSHISISPWMSIDSHKDLHEAADFLSKKEK